MFKFFSFRFEFFIKVNLIKVVDIEVCYGLYEDVEVLERKLIIFYFENNQFFVVVEELVREIEILYWGNVYIMENYNKFVYQGVCFKGGFFRFEYQVRFGVSGVLVFWYLFVKFFVYVNFVYYWDEIGNILMFYLRFDF